VPPFDGFVNPGLVAGVALAAVPLAIHLLNRQRYRPMPWAAMRFVLAAYKKTRRRANLENLILLLLRMAAVALFALAIARPFLGDRSPLAQLAQTRRDVVLVLDTSASTGYRTGVRSVHEDIVERAKALLLELDSARDDRVRLIAASSAPRLLSWRRPDEALSVLSSLSGPDDEPLDLAAALGEVARLAEEDAAQSGASSLEIRLLTDLQRNSFEALTTGAPSDAAGGAGDTLQTPAVVEQLERLAQLNLKVWVEDFGASEATPPNLGVVAIEPVGDWIGAGAPVEIAVSVHNYGTSSKSGVRVSLTIDDDQRLPFRPLDVPARGEARAVFTTSFKNPGAHTLVARIDADRLAADDTRAYVLETPPTIDVLLVNGDSAPEIERDEIGYLFSVLDPLGGDEALGAVGLAPFSARAIQPHEFGSNDVALAQYDVIVLANLEGFSAQDVAELERWTAAGGALVLTMGRKVEPGDYNLRLHKPDGSGLLPAELGSRVQIARRDGYFRVRDFVVDHPAFAFFSDERWKPLFTEAPTYEFFQSRPDENARVLARFDDDASSPLLIEKRYDHGSVFLWTTTIDPEWTRIPESPRTFVPLVHEWFRYAGRPVAPARNLSVGAPLIAQLTSFPRGGQLVSPDDTRRTIQNEPVVEGVGRWSLAIVDSTPRVGLYRMMFDGAPTEAFAVGLDAREGDLDRLAPNELASLHRALALSSDSNKNADEDAPAPTRGELWRFLAILCFAALCLETLWAAWVGRSRRIA